jgi:hypothetical protein
VEKQGDVASFVFGRRLKKVSFVSVFRLAGTKPNQVRQSPFKTQLKFIT